MAKSEAVKSEAKHTFGVDVNVDANNESVLGEGSGIEDKPSFEVDFGSGGFAEAQDKIGLILEPPGPYNFRVKDWHHKWTKKNEPMLVVILEVFDHPNPDYIGVMLPHNMMLTGSMRFASFGYIAFLTACQVDGSIKNQREVCNSCIGKEIQAKVKIREYEGVPQNALTTFMFTKKEISF